MRRSATDEESKYEKNKSLKCRLINPDILLEKRRNDKNLQGAKGRFVHKFL